MMDEPYTLKIFLPSTKLRRLGLIVNPISFADDLPKGAIIFNHQLKNTDLLNALTRSNKLTLKIETQGEIFMSKRGSNKRLSEKSRKEDIRQGTKTNYLIWVRCKDLKEFALVNGASSTDIEHHFKPLARL